MTQEDKDLVLKDMCSRVPYGLRLWIKTYEGKPDHFINSHNILSSVNYTRASSPQISINGGLYDIEGPEYSCGEQYIKPYLRPMSSMTEDERKEFVATQHEEVIEQYPHSAAPSEIKILSYTTKTFDWLNANHFDYHGLILKGLALKAPEGMY